jgi:hypothetical protein
VLDFSGYFPGKPDPFSSYLQSPGWKSTGNKLTKSERTQLKSEQITYSLMESIELNILNYISSNIHLGTTLIEKQARRLNAHVLKYDFTHNQR